MAISARHVRGGISIRFTEADIKLIAEKYLPEELYLDKHRFGIEVNDESALAERLAQILLAEDTLAGTGRSRISSMIEIGLTELLDLDDASIRIVKNPPSVQEEKR